MRTAKPKKKLNVRFHIYLQSVRENRVKSIMAPNLEYPNNVENEAKTVAFLCLLKKKKRGKASTHFLYFFLFFGATNSL